MAFRCLFHVHTRHSFDSLLSPKRIVAQARKLDVGALIVTDHNTIEGSLAVRKLVSGDVPIIPVAAEYQSEKGDIIGLFLREEIRSRDSSEIIRLIRAQKGLVLLPHPFKGHRLDDALLSSVDLVEAYNARCTIEDNERASALAKEWQLPTIAGADAHCLAELGAAVNEYSGIAPRSEAELRKLLLQGNQRLVAQPASLLCKPYSQMIKAVKTNQPELLLYQAKRLVLALARGGR